jgi:hypothetical protein
MSRIGSCIYGLLLRMHPPAFREEFGREMALDFEDAAQSQPLAALYWDGIISFARQWTVRAFSEAIERRARRHPSLLAGQYVMVSSGGLTLFDLVRGMTLSVMLFSAVGFAVTNDAGYRRAVERRARHGSMHLPVSQGRFERMALSRSEGRCLNSEA